MTGRMRTIASDPGACFFFFNPSVRRQGNGADGKEKRVIVYVTKASHIKHSVVSLHFILHAPHFKGGVEEAQGVQGGPTKQGIIKQRSLQCSRSHQTLV